MLIFCIGLEHYCIHMDIRNSNNYLGVNLSNIKFLVPTLLLLQVAAALGYRCRIFMPDDAAIEKSDAIVSLGVYRMTAKRSNKHFFHHHFVATSVTAACKTTATSCCQEQGKCEPSFGSRIG